MHKKLTSLLALGMAFGFVFSGCNSEPPPASPPVFNPADFASAETDEPRGKIFPFPYTKSFRRRPGIRDAAFFLFFICIFRYCFENCLFRPVFSKKRKHPVKQRF